MEIKMNDTNYPCTILDIHPDYKWGNRESKAITLEMDYATANALFVDDVVWSTVQTHTHTTVRRDEAGVPVLDENGAIIYDAVEQTVETDMSDYCVAGPIVDNRNGTVTVKMGKPTAEELLAIIMGGN